MPTIILPLPPDALRVNRALGQHWANTRRAKLSYEMECASMLRAPLTVHMEGPWPVHIHITIWLGKGQRCDLVDAGTWAKPAWDVLTRLKVWPDDGSKYLCPATFYVDRDRANPRIELRW